MLDGKVVNVNRKEIYDVFKPFIIYSVGQYNLWFPNNISFYIVLRIIDIVLFDIMALVDRYFLLRTQHALIYDYASAHSKYNVLYNRLHT